MTKNKLDFDRLLELLRRPATDPTVAEIIGHDAKIERHAYMGGVELKDHGVSVMFKEAPWVISAVGIADPDMLHVSGLHLHRSGHEGYAEYDGRLPKGVTFGDSGEAVLKKLGKPVETGGGGVGTVLKKLIPHWIRYVIRDAFLQFQLDDMNQVEMVSIYVPDARLKN